MPSQFLLFHLIFLYLTSTTRAETASKRGLVYIYTPETSDLDKLDGRNTDLSWYYNYGVSPSPDVSLPFVPMLHSLPDASTDFLGTISSLLDSSNPPSTVLSFNEPDMDPSVGGSGISPDDAAKSYLANIAPLRNSTYKHLKVSLPSTSGSSIGLNWLQQFNTSCYNLNPHQGCPADFLATHWYGDFAGMTSWLAQLHALFPALPIWITEFAFPATTLEETQAFFNQSTSFLGGLDYIDRYAWFGTFRADNANSFVGPNVSFLDEGGNLTDLGSWYLGGHATGNLPSDGAASTLDIKSSMLWSIVLVFLVSILS